MGAPRHQALLQGNRADQRFRDARRSEQMPGRAFRRAARDRRPKHAAYGQILGCVVGLRRRSVKVDVVDVMGRKSGAVQRFLHRAARPQSLRMGRRHVIAVRALADAEHHQCTPVIIATLDQRKARAFADGNPVPLGIKRPAGPGGRELQRMKPVERRVAQGVDAADDGRVAHTRFDHARCIAEHFRG